MFWNMLNIILEDSLNIIFEEYVLGDATYIKLERIRTEWETIHVFNICVSYVARKACFQKRDFLCCHMRISFCMSPFRVQAGLHRL